MFFGYLCGAIKKHPDMATQDQFDDTQSSYWLHVIWIM